MVYDRNIQSNEEFYIPERIKTGKSKASFFSAITFKNSNGAWIHPSYFQRTCGFPCIDKPRDSEITINRDISNSVLYRDNQPITGFKIYKIENYIEYDTPVWISDPRGWIFKISLFRLIKWIDKGMMIGSDKTIVGSWVYACIPISREITIINTEWPEYQNACKESDVQKVSKFIKSSMKKKNLEVGKVYRIYNNRDLHDGNYCRAVYLGEWSNIPELKKFSKFLNDVFSVNYYYGNYEKNVLEAENTKKDILSRLKDSKMVFLKLQDSCQRNQVKFNGTNFELSESYKKTRPDRRSVWLDERTPNHNEFSIRFDANDSANECLYVASSLDNMIVRGLDNNQDYKITEDWTREVQSSRRRYSNCTHRKEIIQNYWYDNNKTLLNQVDQSMWNYTTYTLDEFNAFVKRIISLIASILRKPPYPPKEDYGI